MKLFLSVSTSTKATPEEKALSVYLGAQGLGEYSYKRGVRSNSCYSLAAKALQPLLNGAGIRIGIFTTSSGMPAHVVLLKTKGAHHKIIFDSFSNRCAALLRGQIKSISELNLVAGSIVEYSTTAVNADHTNKYYLSHIYSLSQLQSLAASGGSYISVKLDLPSIQTIRNLYNEVGVAVHDRQDLDKLHSTIMYDPTTPYDRSLYTADRSKHVARAVDVDIYGEHKKVLVLVLKAPSLQVKHRKLESLGFKHTYDPYSPHITIIKSNADRYVDAVRKYLEENPMSFTLINEVYEPLT